MLAKVRSFSLNGLDGFEVSVEVDVNAGLPAYEIVGMGGKGADGVAVALPSGQPQGVEGEAVEDRILGARKDVGREIAAEGVALPDLTGKDEAEDKIAPGHAAGPRGPQQAGRPHAAPAERAGPAAVKVDRGED